MNSLNIASIVIFVILPFWVGFGNGKSKIGLIFNLLTVWLYFIFIFFTGRWDFLSCFLRYIFLFLLTVATIRAMMQFNRLVLFDQKNIWGWVKFAGEFLFSLLLIWGCLEVVGGFSTAEKGIDLAFPLTEGYIGQGGSSELINYHHSDTTSQQYALDIVKLNSWGMRAQGLLPGDLTKYAIYGDTIFSPCDGKIVKIKDGLDNTPIGVEINDNRAGNHVVLEYENNLIVMAHMLKHSLMVSAGDMVKKGQPIGRVGNSGRTNQPHLHIHAIAGSDTGKIIHGGNGIPIYFNGRFPVRNDRMKKQI
ncbi:MAG: M23 family metallopeptidase [Bacteroidota bacterium]